MTAFAALVSLAVVGVLAFLAVALIVRGREGTRCSMAVAADLQPSPCVWGLGSGRLRVAARPVRK